MSGGTVTVNKYRSSLSFWKGSSNLSDRPENFRDCRAGLSFSFGSIFGTKTLRITHWQRFFFGDVIFKIEILQVLELEGWEYFNFAADGLQTYRYCVTAKK